MAKIFVIQSQQLGKGDEKLGSLLMGNFLRLLGDSEKKPEKIIFWNDGVKLLCEGSEVLDPLRILEKQGVKLLGCGTCLEYHNLEDKLVVGEKSSMAPAIASMMDYDVVTL